MTGDASRREKVQAVLFSLIMVVSMVGIGAAGFAGSAAATESTSAGGSGSFYASDATSGATGVSEHVIRVNASGTDVDGNDLSGGTLTVNYGSNVNLNNGGFAGEDPDTSDSIDVFVGDQTEVGNVDPADVTTTDDSTIEIDLTGASNADLGAGTGHNIVTIVLSSAGAATLNNPGSSTDVSVTLNDGSNSASINKIGVDMDGDAPITANVGGNDEFYYTLGDALGAASNAEDVVEVTEDLFIEDDPASEVFAAEPYTIQASDVVLNGTSTVTIDTGSTALGGDNLFEVAQDATGVTIEDLTINDVNSGLDRAVQTNGNSGGGSANDGLTIRETTYEGFAGTHVIRVGSNDAVGNVTVQDNVLNVGDTNGINVNADVDGDADEFLDVSGNEVTFDSSTTGTTGIALVVGQSNSDGDDTIENNNINGTSTGNNGAGLDISGDKTNLDVSGGTIENVDAGISSSTSGTFLNISDVTLTGIGQNQAVLQDANVDNLEIDTIDVEGDGTDTQGVQVTSTTNVDVLNSAINNTDIGVDANSADTNFNVSNTEVTNSGTTAIDVEDLGAAVKIDSGTSIDQAPTGIDVAGGSGTTYDISGITVNGTTNAGAADGGAGIFVEPLGNAGDAVNVIDSTFTNNEEALNISDDALSADSEQVNVHFNTFENNVFGVGVGDIDVDNNDPADNVINVTFNDFVDNTEGLNVTSQTGDDTVNANYSYWGAPTGPANGGNTQDAFGDGDSVTLSSSSDAAVYPFLTEETGSLITDSQQSGSQLIVLPDPERPIGSANDDNTALVGVANLNGSVGASNPDLFAPSADSQPTAAQSFSGTLSPSNIAQFEVNLSSPGTIDVQGVADGASSNTVQQTYTGQSDSITFSANKSVVSTDVGAEITAQAVDSNGNPVERQGLNVRFAEDSGFNDAGVTLSASDGNTSNNGTATTIVQDAGSLSPGQEFTVLANIDGNVERANFSTAAGEIDSGTSTLRLNDSTNDFGDLQVDSTVDVSAEILDANDNPLEGRTVEFASNGTVEFGSDSVDTNSDGFANTTATVDTETQGVVAINATVGSFNTTSTSSAQRNITTIAGDATQLGFASDSRSMAPGASLNPTVQVQDEFGNFNDTASVNNGISVTSSDTNVISVSGVDDLSSNSDQFTLSAESGGEATITVSSDDSDISGVNDTFVVSDPAAIDLSVAHNVATVSANNSNANTQNQALVTAQFTDSDGSALGVANENISFGLSGSSAELNQSDVTTKSTDGDGNVTILVNGTDTTGTSTIVATAENFTSINRGETTVTTTGSASGISLSPENDTIAQNDEINVTAEFVDDEGRNVPRLTDVSLSADDGNVTTGTTATAPNDDGAVVSTFTYNSSGASESVTITATGGGLFGETTVTIEEQSQSPIDGPAGDFDTDADGDISITELGDAGTAFAQGDLTIAELGAVGQEFAS